MRPGVLLLVVLAVSTVPVPRAIVSTASAAADTASDADAPTAPAVMRGTWVATAGQRVLRGRWSAQVQPGAPNDAIGSWTLDGNNQQVLLQGTWAARKDPRRWSGTWSARVERSTTIHAGTWQADPAGLHGKTFADMLRQTAEHRVAGTWRAGRARGGWWLANEAGAVGPADAPAPSTAPSADPSRDPSRAP
jgi:hypothetical protein